MRVTTAFNRMLNLPGASVTDVGFGPTGVVVAVRLRRRRRVCALCGQTGRQLEISWRFTIGVSSAGAIWTWARVAARSSASCAGCAAASAGYISSR